MDSQRASSAALCLLVVTSKAVFVDENTSLLGSGETETTQGFPLEILPVVFIKMICFIEPLPVFDINFVLPGIAADPLSSRACIVKVAGLFSVPYRLFFLASAAYNLA